MKKSRPLVRDPADRGRVKALLQVRLDQVGEQLKTAGGLYTAARLKERQDVLLGLWGVLLQGTRTATVFADGGPIGGEPRGGETARADDADLE